MGKKQNALFELCDLDFLSLVWRDFYTGTPKKKRNRSGIDGVTFIDFEKTKESKLKEIRDHLLAKYHGGHPAIYKTSPLDVFVQEKPGRQDEHRVICIPTIKDRLIQKALLQILSNKGLKYDSQISFGTGPNKSVKKALSVSKRLRQKHPYIYKTDITSFFDRIDRNKIKSAVQKKVRHKSILPILMASIDSEIRSGVNQETRKVLRKEGIVSGVGLRQGLPLSPLLSNLYLEDFDNFLISNSVRVIRYADDMIVFCDSEEECQAAHDICKSGLSKLGLTIPDISRKSKTKIYLPDEEAEFLGLGLSKTGDSYRIIITKRQIDKVWKKFEKMLDINQNVSEGLTFPIMVRKIDSMIASYRIHYEDADNRENFYASLERWRKSIVRKVLLENYDLDLKNLSSNQKKFLHLM